MDSKLLLYSAILFLTTWSFSGLPFKEIEEIPGQKEIPAQEDASLQPDPLPRLDPALYHLTAMETAKAPDPILAAYRNGDGEGVSAFFAALAGSREIAVLILSNASMYDIAPALAFALCWEESRYYARAVNWNKNDSVDRGLFQLNSQSFPELSAEDFFNPAINTQYAMAHLRWCLDSGGSELSGLAMYNAGTDRVIRKGAPKATLDYISRIMAYRKGIETLFNTEIAEQPDLPNRE
ncbi:MAG: transglycosylase SLT domain-containing protein [Spirochaetaceae bacterium]|nr:transglycosylase SLT domain-containing protein [Spirochaetaceae bacterium]